LSKVIQLPSGKTGIQTQLCLIPKPELFPLHHPASFYGVILLAAGEKINDLLKLKKKNTRNKNKETKIILVFVVYVNLYKTIKLSENEAHFQIHQEECENTEKYC
jgi:hypothetical protein